MPLTLSLLTDTDVPAFAHVDDQAMASWPFAQAMGLNLPLPRQQMVENWIRHGLENDSTQTYLKVTDDATGELIAGALWRIEPHGEVASKADEKTGGKDGEEGGKAAEIEAQDTVAGMTAAFAKARREMWTQFESEFFPDQPYANLQILVTHPTHQKRGAGSQLVAWGTARADERGLKSVLMSSPAGLGVYLKHGFKVVREVEMDLRPFGVDATETRRWLVREPRAKVAV